MEGQPDGLLVQRAKKGDFDAFAELAGRYQRKVFQTVFALTNDHQDADDLSQETFMKAYQALRSFKQQSSFYTWLYRIAINLTLNSLKKKRGEGRRSEIFSESQIPDDFSCLSFPSPEKNSLQTELRSKLREAIESLPLPYKAAFILVEFQDLPHRQAARVLKCSENTVSWRMHRARKILQAKLRPYLEGG